MHISRCVFLGALVAIQLLNRAHAAAPGVNWIVPNNGASFGTGTPILLRASASDSDGTLSSIDFVVAGSNLLQRLSGPLTNGTYSYMWSNAPAGTHQLHAEAEDNAGERGLSASVQIVVTNTPPPNNVPVVNLFQPANGAVFSGGTPILLSANASDSDGTLASIDFFAGATLLRTISGPLTNGVYSFQWTNAPAGMYFLRAEAVDNAGGRGASASVQVSISGVPNLAPVISWIRPTNGASFPTGSTILLTAQAADADGTVSYVDFYATPTIQPSVTVNLGRVFGTPTNSLYSLSWSNAPAGTFHLRAAAGDNLGLRGHSDVVQVVVDGGTNGPPNNLAPVVTWIRPTNGAVFAPGTPILLTVNATDSDGTISYVEFYAGSNYLARGIKAPTNSSYNLTWTNPPAGVFQLRAEAVDNAGGRGVSALVQVFVGSPGSVNLGIVEVPSVGHRFNSNAVVDFLIDQGQSSGGGGVLRNVSVNWDTNIQFTLTVAAPPCMKFLVTVPPGSLARFGGFLWWESTRGGFSPPCQVAASFTDLQGAAFDFSGSDGALSDSHGFFGFQEIDGAQATNSFTFTSIALTGTVAPQYTGNGAEHYLPHLVSSLYLTYSTTETNDPGSFVAIVPTCPLPMARMVSPPGDDGLEFMIYGRPGRTHIVECSEDTVTWTAISTQVMPPKSSMSVRDASASIVGSRFYRVIELP